MTSAHEIRQVLNAHPGLGLFGFGSLPPTHEADFLHQVTTARKWLTENPRQSRIIEQRGSYAIKHLIEQARGTYITNGAAIAAAILEGFAPIRGKHPGPNCAFRRTA
jgi:hypothetical protein